MAITTMRIKAKYNAQVYDGKMTERPDTCGYTRAEARGIFGGRKLKENGGVIVDVEAYERKKKQVIVRTRSGKPKRKKPRKHSELPHAVTETEAERIEEYDARKADAELRRYKSLHADVKARMAERQRKALERLESMEPVR